LRSDLIFSPKNVENFILGIKLFLDDPELVPPGFELVFQIALHVWSSPDEYDRTSDNHDEQTDQKHGQVDKIENLLAD
jgi:hypothetical protein